MATDSSGNVYTLGTDAVYKFSASGTQLWAAPYTASSGINQKEGMAVDNAGNVYITGNFSNPAGSPAKFGAASLVSAGGNDGYLAKLDTNGNFLWAESFGGTGADAGYGVAVDAAGNAFVTGDFSATAAFGQGASAVNLQSAGGTDAFVAKFAPTGDLTWAQAIGGTGGDNGFGIAVDSQGDAYVTGQFSGTVDFDPTGAGVHQLTTFFGAAYILKLDGGGNYLWAEKLNGENPPALDGRSEGDAITVDDAGNVYATGIFGGTVNLNPSGGSDVVTSDFVFPDAYVLKLDSSGGFTWADVLHNVSGSNPFGGLAASGIAVDGQGNVYTTGNFQGIADFDPGPGVANHLSAGGVDAYVSILDRQGNFAGVDIAGENGSDFGWGVAATAAGNIYVAGSFSNTIDFDPGTGVDNVTANGLWDGFLWGLNYPPQAIAGAIWNDQNLDGVRQAGEPGLPGVPVTLYQGTPGSGVQVATTVSDSLGLYSFKGLSTGVSYYIQISTPPGDALTSQNSAGDPTLNSNVSPSTGRSATIVLSANQTAIANAGFQVSASPPTFGLAFGVKTIGFTSGSSIIVDPSGDFYVAGSFDGPTVFGTGAGAVTLSTGANNDFVAKYSPSGALIWVRQAVSSFWQYGPKLQLDALGNVYVSGSMTGQTTFGSTVIAASSDTAFLWKLDSDGNTLWAKSVIGGAESNSVGMAIDAQGNSYVVGAFSGTTIINTSPNPTTLTSVGSSDIFVVKYGNDGTPLWAESFGAASKYDGADSVAIDPSGSPIITGAFGQSLQLGSFTLTGSSTTDFVAKLNAANGTVAWADALASTVSSGTSPLGITTPQNRIAIDSSGNVYTTGRFTGKLQLDPTNSSDLTPYDGNATFISKLDNNGHFVWGKALAPGSGGYDVEGYGIAVDPQGNVYTTGEFAETLNFNPAGAPAANLTAIGSSYDIYISKLDTNGNYVSALQFGGSGEDQGTAITLDAAGNVYATGVSQGPANFSPPPGTYNVGASGDQDIFVLKLGLAGNYSSVNSAPSFAIAGPQQAFENSGAVVAAGFVSNTVAGPAGETNEVLTATVSNDNNALFASQPAIDLSTGALMYTPAAGATGVANVTITLHNNGGTAGGGADSSSQTFTITINPVNQAPSFTEGPNETVNENAGAQTVNGWATNLSAGPPNESGQTLNFIVTSDNSALFAAQPAIDASGNLTFTPAANTSGVAHVTVELHDNGGTASGGFDTSAPQTFTITVNFVNQAPSFTAGANQITTENAGPQTVAGWAANISAGANESSQTVDFQVTADNPALFSVQPAIDSNGNLTYTPALDANGVAHVTVVLHDNGGTANGGVDTSAPQTFTLTVATVNQPPSFTAGGDQTVNEDAGAQTVAGWAANISPGAANEAWQTLNFIVSSDNGALFSAQPSIDPATGNLTYTPAPNANGVAHVTVVLHDDGGTLNGGVDTSAPQTFTITVNAVNDAPSFTAGADQTVNEDAGAQSVAGWAKNISAGPADEAGQTLNFLVSSDSSGLFSSQPAIDPLTGNLSFTPAPNANGVAHVTVMLHDNGGTANGGVDTSASQTFTIAVNPVNDAPSFTAGVDQTVNEDAGAQSVGAWATNISAGPADEASQTLTFQVSSDNLALFSVQPSIDPATGALTYTPAPNANGVAHVTVTLHDNGGTANGGVDASAPQSFTITVNSVNDAPSFTAGPDQTIKENSGEEIIVGWAKNISAGPLNESAQTLSFQISSDNPALFSLQPSIDLNGILTYQAAPHVNGVAHVTVQLFDNGGTANGGVDASSPVTFTVTVNSVNEAPSFTAGPDQTIDEDAGPQTVAGWATNISAGPNEAGQTVNFLVSSDNSALFSVQPTLDAAGNLSYTPAANAYGTANVTVVLHDDGGTANGGVDTSSPQTFTITIHPVNDPPSFTLGADPSVNEDSGPQLIAGWATNISPGPNETGQTLNFLVSSDNSALFSAQPALDPLTGTLTFAPVANAYGVAHVTVALHDDGGTANGGVDTSASQTFTITINQVNDAPSFTAGGNQTVNEDAGPQSVAGWATAISAGANEASQTLDFMVSSDNPGLFSSGPSIDPATGTLSYTPAANASGVAHVSIQLHDNGGTANGGVDTSAAQTFTITIRSVNDAPSFTAGADQSVNQDAGPQTVAWATNISAGPNEAAQALNFLVANDNPSLFSTPPAIDSSGTLTYTPAAHASGVAHVTVQLHNNGGTANGGVDTSAPLTFTINVNFVNQPPSFTAGSDQTVNE
ncbi:MAG TPA: Ig-like domain-containing protein, partial [Pirellulales bacterium]|nr:Ig-like domain-containing protein [Pirellulales bacterium]